MKKLLFCLILCSPFMVRAQMRHAMLLGIETGLTSYSLGCKINYQYNFKNRVGLDAGVGVIHRGGIEGGFAYSNFGMQFIPSKKYRFYSRIESDMGFRLAKVHQDFYFATSVELGYDIMNEKYNLAPYFKGSVFSITGNHYALSNNYQISFGLNFRIPKKEKPLKPIEVDRDELFTQKNDSTAKKIIWTSNSPDKNEVVNRLVLKNKQSDREIVVNPKRRIVVQYLNEDGFVYKLKGYYNIVDSTTLKVGDSLVKLNNIVWIRSYAPINRIAACLIALPLSVFLYGVDYDVGEYGFIIGTPIAIIAIPVSMTRFKRSADAWYFSIRELVPKEKKRKQKESKG